MSEDRRYASMDDELKDVERYLITSSVNGVLAQRLVRTLCEHCKTPVEMNAADVDQTGMRRFVEGSGQRVYQAVGCDECGHTGYSGRTGIHELFVLDEEMHREIMGGSDATTLHAAARRQGMITLYEDGLRKVVQGVTSMEEVLRVTQDQSDEDASLPGAEVEIPAAESLSA